MFKTLRASLVFSLVFGQVGSPLTLEPSFENAKPLTSTFKQQTLALGLSAASFSPFERKARLHVLHLTDGERPKQDRLLHHINGQAFESSPQPGTNSPIKLRGSGRLHVMGFQGSGVALTID